MRGERAITRARRPGSRWPNQSRLGEASPARALNRPARTGPRRPGASPLGCRNGRASAYTTPYGVSKGRGCGRSTLDSLPERRASAPRRTLGDAAVPPRRVPGGAQPPEATPGRARRRRTPPEKAGLRAPARKRRRRSERDYASSVRRGSRASRARGDRDQRAPARLQRHALQLAALPLARGRDPRRAPQARAHARGAARLGPGRREHAARVRHLRRSPGRPDLLGALDAAGARFAMHAKGEQIHVAAWPEASENHHLASRHCPTPEKISADKDRRLHPPYRPHTQSAERGERVGSQSWRGATPSAPEGWGRFPLGLEPREKCKRPARRAGRGAACTLKVDRLTRPDAVVLRSRACRGRDPGALR